MSEPESFEPDEGVSADDIAFVASSPSVATMEAPGRDEDVVDDDEFASFLAGDGTAKTTPAPKPETEVPVPDDAPADDGADEGEGDKQADVDDNKPEEAPAKAADPVSADGFDYQAESIRVQEQAVAGELVDYVRYKTEIATAEGALKEFRSEFEEDETRPLTLGDRDKLNSLEATVAALKTGRAALVERATEKKTRALERFERETVDGVIANRLAARHPEVLKGYEPELKVLAARGYTGDADPNLLGAMARALRGDSGSNGNGNGNGNHAKSEAGVAAARDKAGRYVPKAEVTRSVEVEALQRGIASRGKAKTSIGGASDSASSSARKPLSQRNPAAWKLLETEDD